MTRRSLSPATLSLLVAFVLAAGADRAAAVDGVIELNATRMTAGIASIGDAPGPPLTLGAPGSYVLTGDLFASGTNQNIVEITVDHVTLDLNGFSIRCLYVFTPCKGNGTGVGISSTSRNVTIRNGTVRDMADDGIAVSGDGAVVEGVRALDNGGLGIDAGSGALVKSCVAIGNGGNAGIDVDLGGTVRDSIARSNANIGIAGSFAAVVAGNTVSDQPFGIACAQCTIEGNVAFGNGAGIQGNQSLIRDNTVSDNGGNGISGTGASVIDNRIYRNGMGIGVATAYGGNVLTDNNSPNEVQSSAPGTEISTNFCGTDTICP